VDLVAAGDNESAVHQSFATPNEVGHAAIFAELNSFVSAVRKLADTSSVSFEGLYAPRSALQDVAVIESILKSAESQQHINVPSVL
jgi:predicted dehydrogenase